MKTIETSAHVEKDHIMNIKLKLPDEVVPGDYNVLIVMDKKRRKGNRVFECLSWDWNAWPEPHSFRREDIYGDDGR